VVGGFRQPKPVTKEAKRVSTVFPKWTNKLPTLLLGGVLTTLALAIGGAWYFFTPKYWRVGYMPAQPAVSDQLRETLIQTARDNSQAVQIPGEQFPGFSHQVHAGKLGMDCRYCHSNIEESPEANIPSVSTCIGCHAEGHVGEQFARKDRTQFIREAYFKDEPIAWRRVHKVPDYVRNFPHHVHVAAGVSCYSCHGNIIEQPVVRHVESLSMGWCLECHRNPEPHLVPREKVYDLHWVRDQLATRGNSATQATDALATGSVGGAALLKQLEEKNYHALPQNCGACHY
jgi:Cytochrome c7 and related cytochrome c